MVSSNTGTGPSTITPGATSWIGRGRTGADGAPHPSRHPVS